MRDLPRIEAAYNKLDLFLDQARENPEADRTKIEGEQVLNDQAYFLLCWGQLEIEIDSKCREAIRRRRSDTDWRVRRAWDFYNPDDKRLSGLAFENRAALVLDRKGGKGSPYATTMTHYAVRSLIAHGDLRTTRIDMATTIQDFYVIQSALRRAN